MTFSQTRISHSITAHRNVTFMSDFDRNNSNNAGWRQHNNIHGQINGNAVCDSNNNSLSPLIPVAALPWRHNKRDGVSNHEPHDCLLKRLFGSRSKKTSKLRATGFCEWNSPATGDIPAQRVSNTENISIWYRHLEGWGLLHQDVVIYTCLKK